MKKLITSLLCLLLALTLCCGLLAACNLPTTPKGNEGGDENGDPSDNGGSGDPSDGTPNDGNGTGTPSGGNAQFAPENYTQGLEYVLLDNGYTVIGIGTATDTDLVIPSLYNGKPVVAIASNAFYSCPVKLKSVSVPGSVKTIGEWAFYSNYWLETATVGEGVEVIEDAAFWGCQNLATVTLPDSLLSVGSNAFFNCYDLVYTEKDGGKYLGNAANPYVMLMDVTDTAVSAFTVQDNTKFIYGEAFSGCAALTSISVPSSVISVGQSAFYGCNALTYTTYGNGNYLGNAANPYRVLVSCIDAEADTLEIHADTAVIATYACYGARMTALSIPASVVTVDMGAFYGCYYVTTLTLTEGLTVIDDMAFSNCFGVETVTLPASLKHVGSEAFLSWKSSATVTMASENGKYTVKENCLIEQASKTLVLALKSGTLPTDGSVAAIGDYAMLNYTVSGALTLPESVIAIHSNAFYGLKALTSVTLPQGLLYVGSQAFASTGLTSVTVPAAAKLDFGAFARCEALTEATVPALPAYVFSECGELAQVTLNNAITSIGAHALAQTAITSFNVPVGVTVIDEAAFEHCYALTSVTLPAGLLTLEDDAFKYCYALSNVVLPAGLTNVGNYTFYCCYELNSVYVPASVEYVANCAFGSCGSLTIYCETAALPEWGWSQSWIDDTEAEIVWGYTGQ